MSRPKHEGWKNTWKRNVAEGQRRTAERRRCKECGRGNGYGQPILIDGFYYQFCRYCGHERGATSFS